MAALRPGSRPAYARRVIPHAGEPRRRGGRRHDRDRHRTRIPRAPIRPGAPHRPPARRRDRPGARPVRARRVARRGRDRRHRRRAGHRQRDPVRRSRRHGRGRRHRRLPRGERVCRHRDPDPGLRRRDRPDARRLRRDLRLPRERRPGRRDRRPRPRHGHRVRAPGPDPARRDRDGPRAGRRRRARRHPAARHAPRRRPRVAREHARDAHGRLPRRIRAPARHLRHALAERRRGSARQGHRRRAAGRRGRPDRRRQPRAPAPARRRLQHPAHERGLSRGRDAALLLGRPRGPQRRRPGLPGHPVRARLRLRRLAPPAHDAAHVARRGRPRADLHERQPASRVVARGGGRRPHRRVQRPQLLHDARRARRRHRGGAPEAAREDRHGHHRPRRAGRDADGDRELDALRRAGGHRDGRPRARPQRRRGEARVGLRAHARRAAVDADRRDPERDHLPHGRRDARGPGGHADRRDGLGQRARARRAVLPRRRPDLHGGREPPQVEVRVRNAAGRRPGVLQRRPRRAGEGRRALRGRARGVERIRPRLPPRRLQRLLGGGPDPGPP